MISSITSSPSLDCANAAPGSAAATASAIALRLNVELGLISSEIGCALLRLLLTIMAIPR
jgi:hypothetical protein